MQDVMRTKQGFFALAGFPGVVDAIDCTYVRLYGAPLGNDEPLYVNRKGYHSINVPVVCDASFKMTNVVARWPGSTHDSAILHGSRPGEMFETGRSHRRVRVTVEQVFGQLKWKFPCLSLGLHVAPRRACQIIRACCVQYCKGAERA
ncbi:putative nuclease HARBI1 [Acanthaster planci]|uniref:Nuclease HARBI1 n=1 Tax=Acanthaster planci TaxID=133434 RepID=A0A8B7Z9Q6_ACAPL|nr:putative nuclease HARBI1 [Acanthaster planci]